MGATAADTQSRSIDRFWYAVGGVILLVGLYGVSLYSYALFHSLVELFSVAVAWGVFLLVWNTRRTLTNSYLLIVGMAYLFVGALDLVHTLSYRGMNVFPGYDSNLPTQLWITARLVQASALLVAPLSLGKPLRPHRTLGIFAAATALLLGLVFTGFFPDCYVEGEGLTPFKKGSEYAICLGLATALWLLHRRRWAFDPHLYRMLAASILLTIASEVAFTFYVSVHGMFNLLGHFLKLGAFYLVYRALIETGLGRPYDVLFRELQQSREKYRGLFDNMPNGFSLSRILRDESGRPVDRIYLEVNDSFERITGLRRSEVIGRRFTEVFPNVERDPAGWLDRLAAVASTGRPDRFEGYLESIAKWYAVSAYSPEPGLVATVSEDITQRKLLEQELAEHRERLEELVLDRTRELEQANRELRQEILERRWAEVELAKSEARYAKAAAIGRIGHWERDFETDTAYWSAEVYEIFGVDPAQKELKLRSFLDFVDPRDRETVTDAVRKTIATGSRLDISYRIVRPDGDKRHVHSVAEARRDASGVVSGLEGVLMDVTERRQAEIEMLHLSRLRSIGEVAAGVAHEVNNPVNGIMNYAQVLLDQMKGKDDETVRVLGLIVKEAERVASIVHSLLTFARQRPNEKELTPISDILEGLLPLVQPRLKKAGITLRVEIAPSLFPVLCNAQHIHQVLLNAVTNSWYALENMATAREAGKSIVITAEPIENDGERNVRVAVLDNGPGIPDKILHRVFDPFFTTKPSSEGSGLGLSISHGIVADHGGTLRIDSVEGEYTELTMDLPVAPAAPGTAERPGDPEPGVEAPLP